MAMWHSGHVGMFVKIARYGKIFHPIVSLQWVIGNSCCSSQSLDGWTLFIHFQLLIHTNVQKCIV